MNHACVLLASAAVLAPLALADPGAWHEADGTLTTSLVEAGDHDTYEFHARAGETITARATWDVMEGRARIGIQAVAPRDCGDLPDVDAACVAEGALFPATYYLGGCPGDAYGGNALSEPPVSASLTTSFTGLHRVIVHGGVVAHELHYHLHLAVNGAAPASVTKNASVVLSAGSDAGFVCGR